MDLTDLPFLVEFDILDEGAENDFKKIASKSSRLAFILTGSPRAGKSTVVNKFIRPRSKGLKQINPDDISLQVTKDPNVHHMPATKLSMAQSGLFFKDRKDDANFIYDSTGGSPRRLSRLSKTAKEAGYTVIIVSVLAPLKDTIKRNAASDRHVDDEYLIRKWKQAQSDLPKINAVVKPKHHFVVVNTGSRRIAIWYRYDGSRITK
jgi:predicted ABC-type ATPase